MIEILFVWSLVDALLWLVVGVLLEHHSVERPRHHPRALLGLVECRVTDAKLYRLSAICAWLSVFYAVVALVIVSLFIW